MIGTYFPILVLCTNTMERVIYQDPEDIVSDKAFKILKSNCITSHVSKANALGAQHT